MPSYRVLIEQDEDGVFLAECPSLPGCISQSATRDEAVANIGAWPGERLDDDWRYIVVVPPSRAAARTRWVS